MHLGNGQHGVVASAAFAKFTVICLIYAQWQRSIAYWELQQLQSQNVSRAQPSKRAVPVASIKDRQRAGDNQKQNLRTSNGSCTAFPGPEKNNTDYCLS
jgi:hypothetical protein